MKDIDNHSKRIYFTLFISLCICGLLTWQHFNGGVPKHHILHRADLPSISNWWGGLLLPALTWFMIGRINKRHPVTYPSSVIISFAAALLYGIVLAASFVNGVEQVSSLMGPGLLVLSLFFPIYRAECVLGFVLSMSYTFGAILPTAFSIVVGTFGFVIYNYVRSAGLFVIGKLKRD